MLNTEYINPKVLVSPQTAFYSEKTRLPIRETSGRICAEFVMCYPPGIPILAPGELITDEIIEYVLYAKEKAVLCRNGRSSSRVFKCIIRLQNKNVAAERIKNGAWFQIIILTR